MSFWYLLRHIILNRDVLLRQKHAGLYQGSRGYIKEMTQISMLVLGIENSFIGRTQKLQPSFSYKLFLQFIKCVIGFQVFTVVRAYCVLFSRYDGLQFGRLVQLFPRNCQWRWRHYFLLTFPKMYKAQLQFYLAVIQIC